MALCPIVTQVHWCLDMWHDVRMLNVRWLYSYDYVPMYAATPLSTVLPAGSRI
jgi:hypothetical protein